MKTPPRGIRNRNPGNIRRSGDRWQGLAPVQSDLDFFVFESPLWGIRAMARILRNYQRRYGLRTINQIVARWAPAVENDTAAYAAAVAKAMRIGVGRRLDLSDDATLRDLIAAIIRHENGIQPYGLDIIETAIDLA